MYRKVFETCLNLRVFSTATDFKSGICGRPLWSEIASAVLGTLSDQTDHVDFELNPEKSLIKITDDQTISKFSCIFEFRIVFIDPALIYPTSNKSL